VAERDEDVRDELPEDLDAAGYVGPYTFPDNARRRIPGSIYLGVAALLVVLWATAGDDAVLVNDGFLWCAIGLALFGVYCFVSGVKLGTDETDALVAATKAVGFPVGHASAQLGWRGLRSVPTWRVLVFSAEEPPKQRGFVLIDAASGDVLDKIVEDNPEQWEGVSPDEVGAD